MKAATVYTPSQIKFGTDGWRAIIGEDFTFANLDRIAQAYADFVNRSGCADPQNGETSNLSKKSRLIIIGYDRRFLSEKFAQRVTEVLAGNNLQTALFNEAVPTPLISWTVREKGAAGGVVITASHNPAEFNGFKIKAAWGGSASPETTQAVEDLIDINPRQLKKVTQNHNSEVIESATESYRNQISSYVDLERICAAKTRIIIDPMHGAGGHWVESFLRSGNLHAETIRSSRDPLFGGVHPEPIDANLSALKHRVLETKAVLGLATDGDADRLGAVNEHGQTMTMHEVVPLLLLHLIRNRKMSGGVICTFSQSVLIKRIAEAYGFPLFETPIGFKHIADLMLREDILIGAEESGGIGVKGHIPERDGILNSLLLLEAIITAEKMPSEIVREIQREFGEFYFDRKDLKMEVARGKDFVSRLALNPPSEIESESIVGVKTDDGTKLLFKDESWLLFRQSGTEPLLRIYSEATSLTKTKALLRAGESIALKYSNLTKPES